MRNASLKDCQLLAESEILQRDLFVAAKDQKDHPKKREHCVQHEAGSVSASSLKSNRLRDRWDLARHSLRTGQRNVASPAENYRYSRSLCIADCSGAKSAAYIPAHLCLTADNTLIRPWPSCTA